jgi:hypothetical protein
MKGSSADFSSPANNLDKKLVSMCRYEHSPFDLFLEAESEKPGLFPTFLDGLTASLKGKPK